ncbi:phytase [Diaphorobacter caeni]|uniref:phytase n=1 Tax=Diaphorobacter caeni TaxID=2784387 RepID=UPI001E606DE5|nr:phytase [Diaphorobacter caeni]
MPATFNASTALVALPNHWLSLEKRALVLRDEAGRERARLAVRGAALDARIDRSPGGGKARAWVLDANLQSPIPVDIDLLAGTLTAQPALRGAQFGVEAMCAYRDALQLDHLFMIGKDGHAEQWLLADGKAQLYRSLALPPDVKSCQVDDLSGMLLVAEPHFGAWAYSIAGEGIPSREPVLLRKPYGPLGLGAGAVAALPGGAAVLSADGRSVHLARAPSGGSTNDWKVVGTRRLAAAAHPEVLASRVDGEQLTLVWHGKDKAGSPWQAAQQHWRASASVRPGSLPSVQPSAQTAPVATAGDAADDPAIWLHPGDPARSLVLGTNKKQGLLVYDLQGKERQFLASGRLNNVDLRQRVRFGSETFDLAVATQRDDLSLVLYQIDGDGKVQEAARLPTDLKDIYGVCLYQPPAGGLEAFVNDKDGRLQHYRITRDDVKWKGGLLRTLRLGSQPEGCVVDDSTGQLFVGEEDVGVWTTRADAAQATPLEPVLKVGDQLHADVEGMAIYHGSRGSYLIVSSQGNDSFVVMDAEAPFRLRGAFRVGINAPLGIDGVSETDGLDVTSANLGGPYGAGMLVVQDGHKRLPDGSQNFKLVPWSDVARALNLP